MCHIHIQKTSTIESGHGGGANTLAQLKQLKKEYTKCATHLKPIDHMKIIFLTGVTMHCRPFLDVATLKNYNMMHLEPKGTTSVHQMGHILSLCVFTLSCHCPVSLCCRDIPQHLFQVYSEHTVCPPEALTRTSANHQPLHQL